MALTFGMNNVISKLYDALDGIDERAQEKFENAKQIVKNIRLTFIGKPSNDENPIQKKSFGLFVKGTDFQIKVWQALLSIPKGTVTIYENIACMIGKPKAVRAAANAIANNPMLLCLVFYLPRNLPLNCLCLHH